MIILFCSSHLHCCSHCKLLSTEKDQRQHRMCIILDTNLKTKVNENKLSENANISFMAMAPIDIVQTTKLSSYFLSISIFLVLCVRVCFFVAGFFFFSFFYNFFSSVSRFSCIRLRVRENFVLSFFFSFCEFLNVVKQFQFIIGRCSFDHFMFETTATS